MTERIYYQDSFCKDFTARVLSCTEGKNGYEIVLDRTAFYPEGGGQSGDRGRLTVHLPAQDPAGYESGDAAGRSQEVTVLDTKERSGQVVHVCREALPEGAPVRGRIDWAYRFDLMQNHSGEHIVSGLIHETFGYNNVGFHMGGDFITIDLDGMLTLEDLKDIEQKSNAQVWSDKEVEIITVTPEEARGLSYRSKKDLEGEVRIVTFPGADVCACCGTHVKRTGQIGMILLVSCVKFRSGVRIEMLCGNRAFSYLRKVWEQNHQISVELSAKEMETFAAVRRVKEQSQTWFGKLYEYELRENEGLAKELADQGNVLLFRENATPDQLRRLADTVMHTCSGVCVAVSGDDTYGYKYALGKPDSDLRTFVKEMNQALDGRGGGKPFFAQGGVRCTKEQLTAYLEKSGGTWLIV